MIFQWKYHDGTRRVPKDYLCMGSKEIGYVHRQGDVWRCVCNLPNSSKYGGSFMEDCHSPGEARALLEVVAAKWVNDACLWRSEPLADTITPNFTKE